MIGPGAQEKRGGGRDGRPTELVARPGADSEALLLALGLAPAMLARERLIEIGVAIGAVATMLVLLYVVGRTYGTVSEAGHRVLTETGGEIVILSVVAFILLMAAAGLVLLRTVTVVEAEDGGADGANSS